MPEFIGKSAKLDAKKENAMARLSLYLVILLVQIGVAQQSTQTTTRVSEQSDRETDTRQRMRAVIRELRSAKDKTAREAIFEKMRNLRAQFRQSMNLQAPPQELGQTHYAEHNLKNGSDKLEPAPVHTPEIVQNYTIPFASTKNKVELTVVNTEADEMPSVTVMPIELPSWIKITPGEQSLASILKGGEAIANFTFSVDKTAPVGVEQSIRFAVSATASDIWTKTIRITVSPPDRFELFQNYPNPFNPVTTISYQLPVESRVALRIYDALGQGITTVVDEVQQAGYRTAEWNSVNQYGGKVGSGVYFFQIRATSVSDPNRAFAQIRKMVLLK